MTSLKKGRFILGEDQITMVTCVVVVFLAQISEKTNSIAIMLLGYLLALLLTLAGNPSTLMAMMLFFLSDNSILDVGGVSIQLLIMSLYLVRFSLLRKGRVYGKTLFAGILITLYSAIYINLGVGYALQGFKLAVMIIFFTEYLSSNGAITRSNYEKQLSYAVMGVFFSAIATICVNPSMFHSSRIALSEDSNWNLLGILSALLFSHSFMMCFADKTKGRKYVLHAACMAACALITTSRTALVVAAVAAVWILLFINEKGTFARKSLIIGVIILFGVLLLNGTIQISFVTKLINRIVNPRRGDISNGRFTLWSRYIDYLIEHKNILWLGHGSPLIDGLTTLTSRKSSVAHNMLIEQITMYGIIGSLWVLSLYISSFNRIIKVNCTHRNVVLRKKFILNILLIFVAGMFSHIITSVLVTTELYLGLMQYIALNMKEYSESA